jgi:pimeloyl-ACP methyl ester carboxylesterase/DNA-binding CsgD family transcriptional regulator
MNRWYSVLSDECLLVRYDVRGTGLSDRNQIALTLDDQIQDLEAVVDDLGLDKFVLFGPFNSGPAALTYAARSPERLSGLVLWCAYAAGEDYFASPKVASIRSLIDDWELYTETGAHAFVGWDAGSAAHELAVLMRESVEPDVARTFLDHMREVDCRALLPQITVPTLVLHPRQLPLIDIDIARRIAAAIPGARFLALDGESLAPTRDNTASAIRAIRELMGLDETLPVSAGVQRQQSTVSSADPAGGLTSRELEILRFVVNGASNREIAERLVLSPRTVERHIANIYVKANVSNRAQITAFALSNGLA